jgi:hypothetical protein
MNIPFFHKSKALFLGRAASILFGGLGWRCFLQPDLLVSDCFATANGQTVPVVRLTRTLRALCLSLTVLICYQSSSSYLPSLLQSFLSPQPAVEKETMARVRPGPMVLACPMSADKSLSETVDAARLAQSGYHQVRACVTWHGPA